VGADVAGYDPEAIETTEESFGDRIDYGEDRYDFGSTISRNRSGTSD
jgi:hypothetical protein